MSDVQRLMERLEKTGLGILGAVLVDNKGTKAEDAANQINRALDYLDWLRTH